MGKKSYALVKDIKNFRPYLVGAKAIVYVPNALVKDIFVQSEVTRRRYRWINKVQEFNNDIQITKLVRRQGLAKLMAEENLEAVQVKTLSTSDNNVCSLQQTSQYANILYFSKHMRCLEDSTDAQKNDSKVASLEICFHFWGFVL